MFLNDSADKTISLCMIVKDEEEVLEGCLKSIRKLVDEIIIVDTGSTDKTKDIAQKYTHKVYDFKWIDDFSAARNYAFGKATMEYIFWLDADDVLLEADQKKFNILKENLNSTIDAVSMIYNIAFDEYGNPSFSFRRNRLVRRNRNFIWFGAVHEYLQVSGNIMFSNLAVTHRKDHKKNDQSHGRNLKIYENRIKKGDTFSPRDLYYYANELKDHGSYEKAIIYYKEFLASKKGWQEDVVAACGYMADCYAQLGDKEKEMEALLQALKYDKPKAEICCRLGTYFQNIADFQAAIVWFELALMSGSRENIGFHQPAYSTWYPHLQLCVCYWQLGELDQSQLHNEEAAKYRPEDPSVLYNRKFFTEFYQK